MTFKVNWEKTHAIHHLENDLIKQMLTTFYPENEIKSFDVIEGGCANINIRVYLNKLDKSVILRVYLRDPEAAYREQKIYALLQDEIPLPQLYHIGKIEGYSFAITEYLSGISLRDFLLNENNSATDKWQIMFKLGKALGSITKVEFDQNENIEVRKNIISNELVELCSSLVQDKIVQTILSVDEIEQIKTVFKDNKNLLPDDSEKNLVHADFDPSNILVEEVNGKLEVSAILDWEFAFSGSTLWDVANMLRYSHKMPREYQNYFLEGLISSGYSLPSDWQSTIKLLNIFSLLDCLKRTRLKREPNRIKDIIELISYALDGFRKVEVVPYNPSWPNIFNIEAKKIQEALGINCLKIHHIGSTSVQGLAAKPIIDMIPVVSDINDIDLCNNAMLQLGYEVKGEFGIPFRHFFKKDGFNIHVYQAANPEIERYIKFRDWLASHPHDRENYQKLKMQLAEKHPYDVFSYCAGKEEFVRKIDKLSGGINRKRMVSC